MSSFAGDKKKGQSVLGPYERKLIDRWVGSFPSAVEGYHLTMITLLWSAGLVLFGWLAVDNRWWLHAMSVMVIGQWFTDSFDGALGKHRKRGLVKWGFFMDHLLDLLFAGCVVIGYSFLAPSGTGFLFSVLLLVTCAMMAVSFLSFAATNQFQIAYYGLGPTEIRIAYVALNTLVFFAGTEMFWWGLPIVLAVNCLALLIMVRGTSRQLWVMDYEADLDGNAVSSPFRSRR